MEKKTITTADLIVECSSHYDIRRLIAAAPGEYICSAQWRNVNGVVASSSKEQPPTAIIYHPSTKPGFVVLKIFYAPFTNYATVVTQKTGARDYYDDYFKYVSFGDVFREVKKQIENGMYNKLGVIPFEDFITQSYFIKNVIIGNDQANLKVLLKFCLSVYPHDFLTSNLWHILPLKNLFADMFYRSQYEPDSSKRKEAEDNLKRLLERPPGIKSSKKTLPPYLYLGGLYRHLYEITGYLKEQHINTYGSEPIGKDDADELETVDKRLVEIAKKEQIVKLLNSPSEFTHELMAEFFNYSSERIKKENYSSERIKKEIEKEKRYSRCPEEIPSEDKHLVHKDESYKPHFSPPQRITKRGRRKK